MNYVMIEIWKANLSFEASYFESFTVKKNILTLIREEDKI